MNATEILSELEQRRIELQLDGDRLRFRPARAVPAHLREELSAHKAEVVRILRAKQSPALAATLPGGTVAADRQSLLAADVVAMRLDEFATARLRVEVTSDVLKERVVFASDNAKLDPGEPLVVYRAAELKELQGLSADELRAVHRAKKLFAGTILPS